VVDYDLGYRWYRNGIIEIAGYSRFEILKSESLKNLLVRMPVVTYKIVERIFHAMNYSVNERIENAMNTRSAADRIEGYFGRISLE